MPVDEGLDVDDDLLAHVDPTLDGCRPHMGQQDRIVQFDQLGIDRRLVLEDVEAGAGHLAGSQHAGQGVLVDHLAAAGVDDDGGRLQQLQAPRREQVIGCRRVRAVDRDDVHAGQHLVEALPIGRLQLGLDVRVHPAPVVIMHREAEALGPARHRLADAAHADDAQALAPDAMAQHRGRAPAGPVAGAHQVLALAQPPRYGEDQGHGHVRRVLGQDARGVGHGDAAHARGLEVDMVDAGAEGGDEAQLLAGLAENPRVDAVGHCRHEDVGLLHRGDQLGLAHRLVVQVQPGVEKLHHPGLDRIRKAAGDDHARLRL